jgi:hypothetical protein
VREEVGLLVLLVVAGGVEELDVAVVVCSFSEVVLDWDFQDEVEGHHLQAEAWQMDHTQIDLCQTSRTGIISTDIYMNH